MYVGPVRFWCPLPVGDRWRCRLYWTVCLFELYYFDGYRTAFYCQKFFAGSTDQIKNKNLSYLNLSIYFTGNLRLCVAVIFVSCCAAFLLQSRLPSAGFYCRRTNLWTKFLFPRRCWNLVIINTHITSDIFMILYTLSATYFS